MTDMYDNTLSILQEKEVVDGRVISMNKREVVVDIGYKSDGIVSVNEFRYNPGIKIGDFAGTVLDFIIVAIAIFLVVKAINTFNKKAEEAPAAPAEPSSTDKLLMEIRDSLKK